MPTLADVSVEPVLGQAPPTPMREHVRPEVFPEHLQPDLLPLPETKREALFLLRCFSDLNLEKRRQREHAFLRPGGPTGSGVPDA